MYDIPSDGNYYVGVFLDLKKTFINTPYFKKKTQKDGDKWRHI